MQAEKHVFRIWGVPALVKSARMITRRESRGTKRQQRQWDNASILKIVLPILGFTPAPKTIKWTSVDDKRESAISCGDIN